MAGDAVRFDPALDSAYAAYRWAQDVRHALTCCIRHIHELEPIYVDPSRALPLFRHGRWPCMYVCLTAMIVGVQVREDSTEYTCTYWHSSQWTMAQARWK